MQYVCVVGYRFIGKLGQFPDERLVHLVGGALEEPPAAAEEERVAGEDGRRVAAAREEVADVAGGVAGGEQAADTHAPDRDLVPVSHQSDMGHWH